MRIAFLVATLVLCGCGKVKKATEYVGITETADEKAAREKVEQEKAAADKAAEQEKVVKERQASIERLKVADAVVQEWADKLGEKQPSGGFKHHEGVTDPDPWGQLVKIEYKQQWANEIMTVTSAGPDGKFGTQDDLIRVRTASNPNGIIDGISNGGWFGITWVGLGLLGVLFATSLNSRRNKYKGRYTREHPLLFGFTLVVLAPLAFIYYGFKLLDNMFGVMRGHPGQGLDGDFDLVGGISTDVFD